MVIEELTREPGTRRNMIPTGKTFGSFTEVQKYCLDLASTMTPSQDDICKKFKIVDNNEVFDVMIGWYSDGEAYVSQSILVYPTKMQFDCRRHI